VDEAGVEDVGVAGQGLGRLLQQTLGLGQQALGGGEIRPMNGANGVGRMAQRVAAEGQAPFASGVLGIQVDAHVLPDGVQALGWLLRFLCHRKVLRVLQRLGELPLAGGVDHLARLLGHL